MSLPFSQVRFRLYNADGTPAADLAVAARLTRPDIDAGVVVPANVVRGTSDTAGEATLFLWPNSRGTTSSQYAVVVSRGVKQVDSFTITVPESVGVVYAEDIRSAAPYPPVSAAQQAIESAQAAVVAASNASRLTIGTVATLGPGEPATAEIAGDPGAQTLSLGIPRGADGEGSGVGGSTNLAYTASPTGGTVTSDTGTDATIPLADGTNAGLMTPSQKAPLDATSGTNTGDQDLSSYSLASHNHTGVYDPAGTAASAVSAHEGAADPHPGYVLESAVGAAGGVASLDGGGQVPAAQIPAIAITEYLGSVASQAAMLALTGQKGDWCIRSDTGTTWIITGTDPTLIGGWTELVYPAAPVSSVAVRSGAVTLTSTDLTDSTTTGRQLVAAADAAAARTAIGAGTSSFDGAYGSLSGKPTLGTASALNVPASGNAAAGEVVKGDDTRLGAATPGGSTTQVQVNDAGVLAGDAGLTVNKTTAVLTAAGGFSSTVAGTVPSYYFTNLTTGPALRANSDVVEVVNGSNNAFKSLKADKFFSGASNAYNFSAGGWIGSGNNSDTLQVNTGSATYGLAGCAGITIYGRSNTSLDLRLERNAAGVAEINNGTAGTYRDLKLRNLIASGNLATGISAKTANYTATANDGTIEVDATSGAVTITLPAVSGAAGRIYVIKKTDASANAVTVDPNASETIDGATTASLASQYSTITIQANAAGTAWHKVSGV